MTRASWSAQSRWLLPAILLVLLSAVFAAFYLLTVQPQREATRRGQQQLEQLTAELERTRAASRQVAVVSDASSGRVESLAALLSDPAVGGATNLSIQVGGVREGAAEMRTPVTVTFDARYEQLARFLRRLPQQFQIESLEVRPQGSTQVHASLILLTAPQETVPPVSVPTARPAQPKPSVQRRREAVAPQPDPVVNSILFSSDRRVARVDGRIVGPGDRVGSAIVRSIEADAVVIVTPAGESRRIKLLRPALVNR